MGSITIKDVATDAGVSTATVSHVINRTRYVSQEMTDRVNSSIMKLKYYPNLLVGSLRSKKSNTIGIVIPSISNETFGALAEGIQKTFFNLNYNIILCNTSYDTELEEKALNTMIMKQADAIILISVADYSNKMKEIQEMGIPVILVDRMYPGVSIDMVRINNFKGEYDVVKYLIDRGHRRIGYVDRKLEQSHSREQRNGYIEALKDRDIPFDPKIVVRAEGHDFNAGVEVAKRLMKLAPDITAVAAYYDIVAVGVMRGLMDLGYSIPDDISVVGFDGMKVTEVTYPRLTTVLTPIDTMVEKVCEVVVKRLEEKSKDSEAIKSFEPVDIVIESELIVRESSK
ncbi:LacI family transcriptional regulator [Clostridia bacterium]|nr:LacI family transcriptional regulator [Clostridia bacterium]